jgi:mannosyltransferase OCH1-like enzyme
MKNRFRFSPFHQARIFRAKKEMYRRSAEAIDVRTTLLNYCKFSRDTVSDSPSRSSNFAPVWQYWDTGPDNAPEIVKACMRSVRRHVKDREIIVLTDKSLEQYVEMPDVFLKVRPISKPHFSDLLRVTLLSKYGGTWLDATVLLTGPIREEILRSSFFAFRRDEDPIVVSSWFLHSSAHHPLVEAMRQSLLDYWKHNDALIHYFTLHFIFEGLTSLYRSLRKEWDACIPMRAYPWPHEMQANLLKRYDAALYDQIASETNIHKLTFKHGAPPTEFRSFFEAIVSS